MAGESISIPILTPGADAAARNIKQVGDAAAGTGAKLDIAAASLEAFNLAAAKSAKADATLVQSAKTHAKALGLVDDAYRVLDGKATVTTKLVADQGRSFDDTAKKAAGLGARFSALAGTGGAAGGGMGALIGAGVVLSPIIATVGTGLAGLGAAAYGIIKPIENAAQKTGGLQANLKLLDPEQRTVARSLLGLGAAYGKFQQALKPEILAGFNDGIRIAGHLMHDVQPVAQATGKALDQVLLSVDKEFQSGTWQQFFGFMAKNAAPDMQLLGKNLTDLLQVIPPLTEDLQPLARSILLVSDDAAKAAGGIVKFYDAFQKNVPISNQHTEGFLQRLDKDVVSLTDHIPGATAVNNWLTSVQHGLTGTGAAASGAAPKVHQAADALTQTSHAAYLTISPLDHLGKAADTVAGKQDAVAHSSQRMLDWLKLVAKEMNVQAAQFEHALTPLENYINATLTQRDDLASLNQVLKASGDRIGYKTQKERDSFAATQTYIDQTVKTGNAALAAHKGIQGQIDVIEAAIPRLEAVKGKTAAYKQELDLLKQILDKLRQEKLIQEQIKVSGSGNWHVVGAPHGNPSSFGKLPFAAGGRVPGSGSGDTVPAMLTPGEAVVPKRLVPAVAPFLKAGNVPGFASGGIVGSYSGSPAGLTPWTKHNVDATVVGITEAIASSMAKSFAQSLRAFSAGGGGFPGGSGGLGTAERAWIGAGGPGGAIAHIAGAIAGAESGWRLVIQQGQPYATTGWGPWQITPGNSEPQFGTDYALLNWHTNAQAAVAKFRQAGNSFSPWTTFVDGAYLKFLDQGGYLSPGWNLAYNGTGRPEQVIPSHGGGARQEIVLRVEGGGSDAIVTGALLQLLRKAIRTHSGGNVQLALGRN